MHVNSDLVQNWKVNTELELRCILREHCNWLLWSGRYLLNGVQEFDIDHLLVC
jgi:hypothetical protein